ncbi:MAG: hypothetical protein ACRYGA_10830 [Janthinobacterium lividum]
MRNITTGTAGIQSMARVCRQAIQVAQASVATTIRRSLRMRFLEEVTAISLQAMSAAMHSPTVIDNMSPIIAAQAAVNATWRVTQPIANARRTSAWTDAGTEIRCVDLNIRVLRDSMNIRCRTPAFAMLTDPSIWIILRGPLQLQRAYRTTRH